MSLNKVIVIIGASSGIGANLARYLSNDAKIHLNKIGLVSVTAFTASNWITTEKGRR